MTGTDPARSRTRDFHRLPAGKGFRYKGFSRCQCHAEARRYLPARPQDYFADGFEKRAGIKADPPIGDVFEVQTDPFAEIADAVMRMLTVQRCAFRLSRMPSKTLVHSTQMQRQGSRLPR